MRNLLTIFLLMTTISSHATGTDLVLRSSGDVHYLGFIKVYDAKLYAEQDADLTTLFTSNKPMCLALIYDVSLTKENFIEAADTILTRQMSTEAIANIQPQLDELNANYQNVESGDEYRLCRQDDALELLFNKKSVVTIESRDFEQAYLGMWLAEKGIDDLRSELLGIVD